MAPSRLLRPFISLVIPLALVLVVLGTSYESSDLLAGPTVTATERVTKFLTLCGTERTKEPNEILADCFHIEQSDFSAVLVVSLTF